MSTDTMTNGTKRQDVRATNPGPAQRAYDNAGLLDAASGNLAAITATATELNYSAGVTSAIQTQLNAKAATSHNHAASNITSGTLANARISQASVTQHRTAMLSVPTANGILDDSSNEQVLFTKTTSAVNYLNVTNSATGVGPKLEASGSDTNIPLQLGKKGNGAIIAGDLTGNARGTNAVDIQSGRSGVTQVASGTASSAVGYNNTAPNFASTAFGYNNTAEGFFSTAFGYFNTAEGDRSSAAGHGNSASGTYSSAFGYSNIAEGNSSSAFGRNNTASGTYSSAVGHGNLASVDNSSAVGHGNSASGNYGSSAIGFNNEASGNYSTAVGRNNLASGNYSTAVGRNNIASGYGSSAIGSQCKTTIDNTAEMGYWSSTTVRAGAVRMHPNGQVAMTIEDSATAPTDGGATAGSEADATLGRGMYSIQKNGTAVTLYFNNAGTIQSLSLGTLS